MADCDLRDQISRLEAHIEELAQAGERCRKIILIAKVAFAVGGIWMVAITLGLISFDPMAMVGAIAVVLGAIVIFGSHTATSKQIAAAIKGAEALRAELIGRLKLQVVGDGVTQHD